MSLLDDLNEGERANRYVRTCQACDAIQAAPDDARDALIRALAGTIGEEKLAKILNKNGFKVGRRAIARHRREEHSA
jgi:hypothetical protein